MDDVVLHQACQLDGIHSGPGAGRLGRVGGEGQKLTGEGEPGAGAGRLVAVEGQEAAVVAEPVVAEGTTSAAEEGQPEGEGEAEGEAEGGQGQARCVPSGVLWGLTSRT
jgi:hypothetical protein